MRRILFDSSVLSLRKADCVTPVSMSRSTSEESFNDMSLKAAVSNACRSFMDNSVKQIEQSGLRVSFAMLMNVGSGELCIFRLEARDWRINLIRNFNVVKSCATG